jgi:hypothetical protein
MRYGKSLEMCNPDRGSAYLIGLLEIVFCQPTWSLNRTFLSFNLDLDQKVIRVGLSFFRNRLCQSYICDF